MKVTVIPTITAFPWGAPGHCMAALVEELLEAGHKVQWFVAAIDLAHPGFAEGRRESAVCAARDGFAGRGNVRDGDAVLL